MATLVLSVMIVSMCVSLAMWILVSCVIAMARLGVREIFSARLFSETWSNMTCSAGTIFIAAVACAIALTPAALEGKKRTSAAERGECACRCRKCKDASGRVEAVIRYLALDDEDLRGAEEEGR